MTARVAPWAAVGGYRTGSVYFQGSSSAPAGGTSMSRLLVVRQRKLFGSAQEDFASNSASDVNGWRFRWNGSNLRFMTSDGSGSGAVSPQLAVNPPPGTVCVLGGSYDGTTGYFTIGEALSASAAAGTAGYTPPTHSMTIGQTASLVARELVSAEVLALLATDSVARTDAQLLADAAVVGGNLAQGRGLSEGLAWAPERYWDAGDWTPGTDWLDRIAGQALAPTGSPQLYAAPGRV